MRLSSNQINLLYSIKGKNCWYCGVSLDGVSEFEFDHFFPKSRGGENDLRNLVPCCPKCNHVKGSKTLEEFRKYLELKNKISRHVFYFETAPLKLPKNDIEKKWHGVVYYDKDVLNYYNSILS